MITDSGEIQREPEPQTPSIKPFLYGIEKDEPSWRTEGCEIWKSSDIGVKSLGMVQAFILTPRDEQAFEESPEFARNRPVYVVDTTGEVKDGLSQDYFLKDYGALRISLRPPEKISHELYEQKDLSGKKIPKVNVGIIVWISEEKKFKSSIKNILIEGSAYEYRLIDKTGRLQTKKPLLVRLDEDLLRKINISF